jgi:hypothetical protein
VPLLLSVVGAFAEVLVKKKTKTFDILFRGEGSVREEQFLL